jgi:hypothetical protein
MKTNVSGLKDSKLRHVFNRCSNFIGGMMVSTLSSSGVGSNQTVKLVFVVSR